MKNRTIGGFIQLDTFTAKEFHNTPFKFNLGRSAFLFVVLQRRYKKIYMPYFLCECMSEVLDNYLIDYEYYHIDENFLPVLNKKIDKEEAILIVNYLNLISEEEFQSYQEKYSNIILDNTQAFYFKPITLNKNIDVIYTCRKWFGVPDGAYLYTSLPLAEYKALLEDVSNERMSHFLAKYEVPNGDYYDEYSKIEKEYSSQGVKKMSKLTANILGAIDYLECKKSRMRNYSVLQNELGKINKLNLNISGVPYMYPLYLDKADELRRYLIKNRCFTPLLWSNVVKNDEFAFECKLAKNIIYLHCDQRYNEDDMLLICDYIKSFLALKK